MLRSPYLDLDCEEGIVGDINPPDPSPRQLCLANVASLAAYHVKPSSSRANMVITCPTDDIESGCIVRVGGASLRITFQCEPCAHGARMAEAPMRQFRNIGRHLALVLHSGRVTEGDQVDIIRNAYPKVPSDFRQRCSWAMESIPPGHVVTSLEFLSAIGAGRSYLRVLPRWLAAAKSSSGSPVHRVLTASLGEPSWCPTAHTELLEEGIAPDDYPNVAWPLTQALWTSRQ
jgi:alkylated DNA nucleotide flippase Atl1